MIRMAKNRYMSSEISPISGEEPPHRVEQIGDRIKEAAELIGGISKLAELVGIPRRTLVDYIRGSTEPKASALDDIAAVTGADLAWLIRGGKPPRLRSFAMRVHPSATASLGSKDLQVIPRYDVRPSAGAGALVISEDVSEHFAAGRDWLRRNLPPWAPLNAEVGILEGSGDSMWPTIHDGDLLMIVRDVDWRVVERGGVFVLTVDDRFLLKRLNILMNGDLEVISDNKAYRSETIPMAELEERVRIHGFVFRAVAPLRGFLS